MPRIAVLLLAPAALLAAVAAGITLPADQDAPVTQHTVADDGFGWSLPVDGSLA
ncbi:hypothetical protein ABZ119_09870 [Streptomyces sp. NPDC006288]|uniref:hypothetical protein n=1 Tax=Streptomyces sp. NPDC006288 TaxID=3156743 RepID=UPI0033AEF75C